MNQFSFAAIASDDLRAIKNVDQFAKAMKITKGLIGGDAVGVERLRALSDAKTGAFWAAVSDPPRPPRAKDFMVTLSHEGARRQIHARASSAELADWVVDEALIQEGVFPRPAGETREIVAVDPEGLTIFGVSPTQEISIILHSVGACFAAESHNIGEQVDRNVRMVLDKIESMGVEPESAMVAMQLALPDGVAELLDLETLEDHARAVAVSRLMTELVQVAIEDCLAGDTRSIDKLASAVLARCWGDMTPQVSMGGRFYDAETVA